MSILQHLLDETFMMLVRIFSSIPSVFPRAKASEIPIISIANAILLQTFAICPAPILLQLKIFFPIAYNMGLTVSKISAFSAPTIKVNVPAAAPVTPPDTGAST